MPFHLCGFSESQDSAVLIAAAALQDQALQINGDDIIIPSDLTMLLGVFAVGPDATRAQIISPSIRRQWPLEVIPLCLNATPNDDLLWTWYGDGAIQLDPGEQMNGFMAEGNAAASRVTILTLIADRPPTPVLQESRTIRVTATGTAVASAWTNVSLAFSDVLPAGNYALVGATMVSTTLQAFRFVFKGGAYRPGWTGKTTLGQRHNPLSRAGGLGVWGTFEHLTPPSMDVLCTAADSAWAGELDLIYLGR